MGTDKDLLRNRFAASYRQYDSLAVVQDNICDQLVGMIVRNCPPDSDKCPDREVPEAGKKIVAGDLPGREDEAQGVRIARALEIGAGTGFLTRRLLKHYPHAFWTINDLAEEASGFLAPYLKDRNIDLLWGDAETIGLPRGIDLTATASTVQWFDDLPGFFERTAAITNPSGFLAMSTFGPENFHEIKATTGEGLDYYRAEEITELMRLYGWGVVEHLEYTKRLEFGSPLEVLYHIRATGVNSIRKARWTRSRLAEFETRYRELFSTAGGKVTLTYHPILVVAEKR